MLFGVGTPVSNGSNIFRTSRHQMAWYARCELLFLAYTWFAEGVGYRAREAALHVTHAVEIPRVASGSMSGEELLSKYVLADEPVVIEGRGEGVFSRHADVAGAVSESILDRIRAEAFWQPGKYPVSRHGRE